MLPKNTTSPRKDVGSPLVVSYEVHAPVLMSKRAKVPLSRVSAKWFPSLTMELMVALEG